MRTVSLIIFVFVILKLVTGQHNARVERADQTCGDLNTCDPKDPKKVNCCDMYQCHLDVYKVNSIILANFL